jgi:hypothetical protein
LRAIADKKGLKYKDTADRDTLVKKISTYVYSHGLYLFLKEISIHVLADMCKDKTFVMPKKLSKYYYIEAFENAVKEHSLAKVLEGLVDRKKDVVQSFIDEGCPQDSDDENMDDVERIEKAVRAYGQGSCFSPFSCDELRNFAERSGLEIASTQSASILIDCLLERTNYKKKKEKKKKIQT